MKKKIRIPWYKIVCAILVMLAAVLVRLPAVRLPGVPETAKQAWTKDSGQLYLNDYDSYYHVRITDQYLDHGTLGDSIGPEGEPWDTISFYPEGRSAEYQPGIVWLTAGVYRILHGWLGTELYSIEFWLIVVMAALSGLAAFAAACRISKTTAGGVAGGILVSCGTSFVQRSLPGRFDTDMFVILLEVLLILLLTEALRAKRTVLRLLLAAGFAMTVTVYTLCWSVYGLIFAALTLAGGLLYFLLLLLPHRRPGQTGVKNYDRPAGTAIQTLAVCTGLSFVLVLLANGPAFFKNFIEVTASSGEMLSSGILPNLFASISELQVPGWSPSSLTEWFSAFVPGKRLTVVNGIGGGGAALLCLAGLATLIFRAVRAETGESRTLERKDAALYACVLFVWLAGCAYAVGRGVRFVEHLNTGTGILAGAMVGFLVPIREGESLSEKSKRILLSLVLTGAAAAAPLLGALSLSAQSRPSVSDAQAHAMHWIREEAEDPGAVAASWWDAGYYYEAESGHPALWDGGCQSGIRAVLLGKILTAKDPAKARNLLTMLCSSGDQAAEFLMTHLEAPKAFEAIETALPLEKDEACSLLESQYNLSPEEAETAEALIHAQGSEEIYLVLSSDMLQQLGWIEYYADWDFTGMTPAPIATMYNRNPHTGNTIESEAEEDISFFEQRKQELIWQLFFEETDLDVFQKTFEEDDTVRRVQIWKLC